MWACVSIGLKIFLSLGRIERVRIGGAFLSIYTKLRKEFALLRLAGITVKVKEFFALLICHPFLQAQVIILTQVYSVSCLLSLYSLVDHIFQEPRPGTRVDAPDFGTT